jgi:hypothetical protein
MQTTEKFMEVLSSGLSSNNERRKESEDILMNLREREAYTFFFELTKVFTTEDVGVDLRLVAGTVMSMSLSEFFVGAR